MYQFIDLRGPANLNQNIPLYLSVIYDYKSWTCRPHYTISLKGVEVGNTTLCPSSDPSKTQISGVAIIDNGTTLAYLPDEIYKQLMPEIYYEV